jgi:16S rRNA (cytidine1402-2'-O)-methyltransferase
MKGQLVLVPTPIHEDLPLEPVARERLLADAMKPEVLLLVEEHKATRGRWLRWGLPREAIERYVLFNEHTQAKLLPEVLRELRSGKTAYLLSDCGLPAFCDPGTELVDTCHKQGITVTATPFPNSIALAVALSGFSHERFVFSGFVPVKEPAREQWLRSELRSSDTLVWMETPYRLQRLLEELEALGTERELFLALDLGGPQEELRRGRASQLKKSLGENSKREFVLVVGPRQDKIP